MMDRHDEIRARCDKVISINNAVDVALVLNELIKAGWPLESAEHMANSFLDVPYLLGEVSRLTAELETVRKLHEHDCDNAEYWEQQTTRLTAENARLGAEVERLRIPAELWCVCVNPKSNDFNDEPEMVVLHYTVFACDEDAKKYWVELDGWHGFKQRHWLPAKMAYMTKKEADDAAKGGGE